MGETPGATERYLDRLAQGLEALGPDETADVVAEVRAHLAEALADAGGDEEAALARFGTSDALATRILEERGILSPDSRVPEAPGWLRLGALAADVALWLAVLAVVLVPAVGIPMFVGTPALAVVAVAWAALAVVVVGSAWWLVKRWRRPGRATVGMRLVGVRRIRLGGATRIVRRRDVPGSPAESRLWPLVATALAVFVLASLVSSLDNGSLMQSRMSNAVHDAFLGRSIVEDLYRSVSRGATQADLEGSFAPSAQDAIGELIRRRSLGMVDSYEIGSAELGDYPQRLASWPASSYTIVVYIPVLETGKGQVSPAAPYRWEVVCEMVDEGDGTAVGEWLIRSAQQSTE